MSEMTPEQKRLLDSINAVIAAEQSLCIKAAESARLPVPPDEVHPVRAAYNEGVMAAVQAIKARGST